MTRLHIAPKLNYLAVIVYNYKHNLSKFSCLSTN